MKRNKQIIKALGLYVKSKKHKSHHQFTTPALGGSISGDIILSDKYYFTDDNENGDCIYVQRNTVIKRMYRPILKRLTTLFVYHHINGSLHQLDWSKYNIVRR